MSVPGTAWLSADGVYRFSLERAWDATRPSVLFVMLNPSTADANQDDPTIRRCVGFAKCWGFGRLLVGNLSPFRSPKPKDLLRHPHRQLALVANYEALREMEREAALTVVAWGNYPSVSRRNWPCPIELDQAFCLGTTKNGAPRHPLYVRADTPPVRWLGGR